MFEPMEAEAETDEPLPGMPADEPVDHTKPSPGLYYWRTPTGWWYQVDHRGTRPLGRDKPAFLSTPIVVTLDLAS